MEGQMEQHPPPSTKAQREGALQQVYTPPPPGLSCWLISAEASSLFQGVNGSTLEGRMRLPHSEAWQGPLMPTLACPHPLGSSQVGEVASMLVLGVVQSPPPRKQGGLSLTGLFLLTAAGQQR